jgi:hypothetical protein
MEKILIMMAEYFDLTIRNKIHEKKLIKMMNRFSTTIILTAD